MGTYICPCGRDHPDEVILSVGCPFEGRPPSAHQRAKEASAVSVEDVIALAERQREREREAWRLKQSMREQEEGEHRERQRAKLQVLMSLVKAEHHAEVAAQNKADMARVHEIADGQHAAEEHERRTRIRQMIEKLGRSAQ